MFLDHYIPYTIYYIPYTIYNAIYTLYSIRYTVLGGLFGPVEVGVPQCQGPAGSGSESVAEPCW